MLYAILIWLLAFSCIMSLVAESRMVIYFNYTVYMFAFVGLIILAFYNT